MTDHEYARPATTTYTGPARRDRINYIGSLYARAGPGLGGHALTPDQVVVQQLAEALDVVHSAHWPRATTTPIGRVYPHLLAALHAAIKAVYGIGDVRTRKVLILLANRGADDACPGTSGRGIASYVEYVKAHPGLSL